MMAIYIYAIECYIIEINSVCAVLFQFPVGVLLDEWACSNKVMSN